MTCFKENSKISCFKDNAEIDINIQDLKNGDLVKTLKNGYLPISIIGKKICKNPNSLIRIKDRLYKLAKNKYYPELKEDLILTGSHSILEIYLEDYKKSEIILFEGGVYFTDNLYRLPTYLDNRTDIYDDYSDSTVYNFALGDDENTNYGIYANGLLVECSFINIIKNEMTVL
jgi:hypothetical protein